MEPEIINRDELQKAIIQLEQALHSYSYWYGQIMRTITCHISPDQRDLSPEAYKQCNLGQWYYNYAVPELHKHPGFIALGDAHEYMHTLATQILQESANNQTISTYDYDKFANAVERLQLEINSLKRELEASIYTRDPLTGAINRTDMLPILRELYDLNIQRKLNCALVMVDLDKFKAINDTYGHAAGDDVLANTARYLMQNVRGYDKVFRYGGEEFLLCLTNVDPITAYDKTESLRQGLAELKIDIGNAKSVNVTASFGIMVIDHNLTLEENLDRADKAMYNAKNAGRNCVVILEPGQGH